VAACLRAVPVHTLIADAGQVESPFAGGAIGPIVNGTTLPLSPGSAFVTGQFDHDVSLIIGVTRDEFNGGVYNAQWSQTPRVSTRRWSASSSSR
jgi:para-nitrobenzyl esterase